MCEGNPSTTIAKQRGPDFGWQSKPGPPYIPEPRARQEREPQPQTQQHLRNAYQVTKLLCEVAPPAVVQNWLLGMNPYLNDDAPAMHITDSAQSSAEGSVEAGFSIPIIVPVGLKFGGKKAHKDEEVHKLKLVMEAPTDPSQH